MVEPDKVLADTYKGFLESKGYQLLVAAGAQTAITLADQKTPDLVILELQLIEHSGIEFLYEFRSYKEWQKIPIIIHSQVPSREFKGSQDLLKNELGVDIYLYKPQTSLKTLLDRVGELSPVKA